MNGSARSVRFPRLLFQTMTLATSIYACSGGRGKFDNGPDLLPPEPEAGAPEAAGPTCGIHCSRDMKQVLDGCAGDSVIEQCNADQGCGSSGKCVDACTAAAETKGSAGCDFWTVPPVVGSYRGSCLAVMIANTWDRAVNLTGGWGDQDLDISGATYVADRQGEEDPVYTLLEGPLPVGKVGIVFLAHDVTRSSAIKCPIGVKPALHTDAIRLGTARSKAFHLKSDAPVSAYSIYPYGGAQSYVPAGTLLLPASSWTQSYVAVSPSSFGTVREQRSLQIIANEDDTKVSMRPTVDVVAGSGVPGVAAGATQTWTLAKGEVIQFFQITNMTGSAIESTKPVAVFGGAESTGIPGGAAYNDALHQQIPPLSEWGTEYAVVPYKPRIRSFSSDVREKVPYTIVGAVDGTVLTYDPSTPRDAPETLGAGESVSFMTDEIFVVRSQDAKHPFHVNVYMTGAAYPGSELPGGGLVLGDPEFVNIPPTDQYLDRYVFFTDFTFQDTTLTVVRRRTATGFVPVELECAGEITGFMPLGSNGEYEYAWVQLTTSFLGEKFAKGTCNYGRQEAHSTGPFAITVWGLGQQASYGYVGGIGLRPINDVPLPGPH